MVKVSVRTRRTSGWAEFNGPVAMLLQGNCCNLLLDTVADLRKQFAIVLQDPVLFSTSIAENIAYANPDATYEEIVAAARAANAHEFTTKLPEGYDTQVGERGMRLSGGERQHFLVELSA